MDSLDRFWRKVSRTDNDDDCWLWTGSKDGGNYGVFFLQERNQKAHRASWLLHYGAIPDRTFVLHRCDNPSCVNPKHLFLGSHIDNMQDMARKGRSTKGERSATAKLTETQIEQVFKLRKHGWLIKDIAIHLGVGKTCIQSLLAGTSWTHLNNPKVQERPRDVGEEKASSKLTETQVREIFALHRQGWQVQAIADKFNVCKANIYTILSGKTWGHLGLGVSQPKRSKGRGRNHNTTGT